MTRLSLLTSAVHPKTQAELRSIIGTPLSPCLDCGDVVFDVTHTGELICGNGGCPSRNSIGISDGDRRPMIAFTVIAADGVARDFEEERRKLNRLIAQNHAGHPTKEYPLEIGEFFGRQWLYWVEDRGREVWCSVGSEDWSYGFM